MTGGDDNGKRLGANESSSSPGVLTEAQALQLIAFLTSAAEISIHEPTYYGTFRLIDAASRMIGMMLENDTLRSEAFLRGLKTEIDAKKVWMMWDRDAYFDFLRATPGQVAAEVKRLADEDRAARGEGRS
ncbi:MAG: DUF6092 family protein [Thermomicrobiales bacterium]